MSWFMLIMLFLGLLVATPFVLRLIVFQIIYPLHARSMKGAWTKDPRFYAYAEHYEQQHSSSTGGGGGTTRSRGGRHGGKNGTRSRGGGRSLLHQHPSTKAVDSDVPELIPRD